MPYDSRPKLNFYGIVLGICPRDEDEMYSAIFCTASRPDKDIWTHLIKIFQPVDKAEAIKHLKPGQIVQVKCEYTYIADIIFSFAVDWIKVLDEAAIDQIAGFKTHRFPSFARPYIQDELYSCRGWLDEWVDVEWVNEYSSFSGFSRLLINKLKEPGASLLSIDCCCLIIQRLPSTYRLKEKMKIESLCVALYTQGYPLVLPVMMSMGINDDCSASLPIYNVNNVPIFSLDRNDYFQIFRCGQAVNKQPLDDAELKNALPVLYDNLYNLLWGTRVGLPTLYPKRKTVDNLPALVKKMEKLMDRMDVKPSPIVHGWWGRHCYPLTRLDSEKTGIPDTMLWLATSIFNPEVRVENVHNPDIDWPVVDSFDSHVPMPFRKHPPRVIIHPDYMSSDRIFNKSFEGACSVSFEADPRILEGNYRPDKEVWEKVCEWINSHLDNFDRKKLRDEDMNSPSNCSTACWGEYGMVIQVYREDEDEPRAHVFSNDEEYLGNFYIDNDPPKSPKDIRAYDEEIPNSIKEKIVKWSNEIDKSTGDDKYSRLLRHWKYVHS